MKAALYGWTDYPIPDIDEPGKRRPFYAVKVIAYDRNKYVKVEAKGQVFDVKSGYVLQFKPGVWRKKKMRSLGRGLYRAGNLPFSHAALSSLPLNGDGAL